MRWNGNCFNIKALQERISWIDLKDLIFKRLSDTIYYQSDEFF